jgi:hypothetical protein
MIYLGGPFTVRGVPSDFVWRLLEFVTYVLALLVQLVESPGVLSDTFAVHRKCHIAFHIRVILGQTKSDMNQGNIVMLL